MALIHEAILKAMKEIEPIAKNGRNEAQRFKFRQLDDVYNSLHGVFVRAGIFSTSEILSSSMEERPTKSGGTSIFRLLDVRYTFYAADGSSVSTTIRGEGADSGDKATSKAMSMAYKYAMLQLFCIPLEGEVDPDSQTIEVKQDVEALQLNGLRAKYGSAIYAKYPDGSDVFSKAERENYAAKFKESVKKLGEYDAIVAAVEEIQDAVNLRLPNKEGELI